MKNGFTWDGFEADLRGGSFYRAQEELQYGKQVGAYSVYLAATQINDGGWRVDSASQLTNFYGDVGYKANGFKSHLQLTAGDTQFGDSATAPIQLLQNNWSSVYTVPQTTYNKMAMLAWTGAYAYSPTLNFQAGAYFRGFNQAHVDGNPTSLTPCSPFSCVNGSPAHDTFGGIIPDISQNGTLDLAEIDRNWTQSRSLGASLQAVDTDKVNGRDNTLTVGASLDYGWTRFTGNSQFGTFFNDNNTSFPIIPYPYIIDEPNSFLTPVAVNANNTYAGLYALDTFNVTDRLTLTGGGRFNFAGDQSRGRERRSSQRLLGLLPSQSDGRPHLQDHARHQLLRGLRDVQPRADAARTRLRRPQQPLHHRQFSRLGPATQASGWQHFRAGFPWTKCS